MNNIPAFLSKRPQLSACIALGLAVFAVYFPALSNGFLMLWDDQWVVINSYTYHGLAPDNLWRILTEFYHGQYAPLNQFYYTCLYSAFGLNPPLLSSGLSGQSGKFDRVEAEKHDFLKFVHGEIKKFHRINSLISPINKKNKNIFDFLFGK
jgi:hypothetical protein